MSWLLVLITLNMMGCSLDGRHSKSERIGGIADAVDGVQPPQKTKLELFAQELYPLLTGKIENEKATCINCHGAATSPKFALENQQEAWSIAEPLINFSNASLSKLVTKVADGHSPWKDPQSSADVIKVAIQKMIDGLPQGNNETPTLQTSAVKLTEATLLDVGFDESKAAFVIDSDDPRVFAGQGFLKTSQTDGAGEAASAASFGNPNANCLAAGPFAAANKATLPKININQTGLKAGVSYQVWVRVKSPNENANSAYFRLNDAGDYLMLALPINKNWTWQRLTELPMNAAEDYKSASNSSGILIDGVNTAAFKVQLFCRDSDLMFDKVALVPAGLVNVPEVKVIGNWTSGSEMSVLKYSLESILGVKDAELLMDVVYFAQSGMILVNPRIVTKTKDIKVKGLRVSINGAAISDNVTFSEISATVNAPGGQMLSREQFIYNLLSPAKDDQIAIGFDELQVVE